MDSAKSAKALPLIGLAILFFIIGYIREMLFVNIGYREWSLQDPENVYSVPSVLNFLLKFDLSGLAWLRWIFTGVFIMIHLILSLLCVKVIYRSIKYLIWTTIGFSLIFTLSILFFILYYCGSLDSSYIISRQLAGFIQSPFMVIFLIPAFALAERSEKMEA